MSCSSFKTRNRISKYLARWNYPFPTNRWYFDSRVNTWRVGGRIVETRKGDSDRWRGWKPLKRCTCTLNTYTLSLGCLKSVNFRSAAGSLDANNFFIHSYPTEGRKLIDFIHDRGKKSYDILWLWSNTLTLTIRFGTFLPPRNLYIYIFISIYYIFISNLLFIYLYLYIYI